MQSSQSSSSSSQSKQQSSSSSNNQKSQLKIQSESSEKSSKKAFQKNVRRLSMKRKLQFQRKSFSSKFDASFLLKAKLKKQKTSFYKIDLPIKEAQESKKNSNSLSSIKSKVSSKDTISLSSKFSKTINRRKSLMETINSSHQKSFNNSNIQYDQRKRTKSTLIDQKQVSKYLGNVDYINIDENQRLKILLSNFQHSKNQYKSNKKKKKNNFQVQTILNTGPQTFTYRQLGDRKLPKSYVEQYVAEHNQNDEQFKKKNQIQKNPIMMREIFKKQNMEPQEYFLNFYENSQTFDEFPMKFEKEKIDWHIFQNFILRQDHYEKQKFHKNLDFAYIYNFQTEQNEQLLNLIKTKNKSVNPQNQRQYKFPMQNQKMSFKELQIKEKNYIQRLRSSLVEQEEEKRIKNLKSQKQPVNLIGVENQKQYVLKINQNQNRPKKINRINTDLINKEEKEEVVYKLRRTRSRMFKKQIETSEQKQINIERIDNKIITDNSQLFDTRNSFFEKSVSSKSKSKSKKKKSLETDFDEDVSIDFSVNSFYNQNESLQNDIKNIQISLSHKSKESDESWEWGNRLKKIKINKQINLRKESGDQGMKIMESNLGIVKKNAYMFYEIKLKNKKPRNQVITKKDISDYFNIEENQNLNASMKSQDNGGLLSRMQSQELKKRNSTQLNSCNQIQDSANFVQQNQKSANKNIGTDQNIQKSLNNEKKGSDKKRRQPRLSQSQIGEFVNQYQKQKQLYIEQQQNNVKKDKIVKKFKIFQDQNIKQKKQDIQATKKYFQIPRMYQSIDITNTNIQFPETRNLNQHQSELHQSLNFENLNKNKYSEKLFKAFNAKSKTRKYNFQSTRTSACNSAIEFQKDMENIDNGQDFDCSSKSISQQNTMFTNLNSQYIQDSNISSKLNNQQIHNPRNSAFERVNINPQIQNNLRIFTSFQEIQNRQIKINEFLSKRQNNKRLILKDLIQGNDVDQNLNSSLQYQQNEILFQSYEKQYEILESQNQRKIKQIQRIYKNQNKLQ